MTHDATAVTTFIESYRRAFERRDPVAIVAHFSCPLQVTSNAETIDVSIVTSESEWRDQVVRLLAAYRAIGVSSVRVIELTPAAISSGLVQASVTWALRDEAGALLYEFHAAYTLAERGGSLRIVAIDHDELPRLKTCLARARSGGPSARPPDSAGHAPLM